jgi:hypothetical protein
MKMLEDIWSSVVGNATTRVRDPVIGTFLTSWIICNWHYLALLFFGEGNATQRVSGFYKYLSSSDFFAFNSIFVIPFIFTLSYLFIFPWLSLFVKYLQAAVNDKLHEQAVNIDLNKVTQQEKLNKAKLKANPDKQFLEQAVQLDINREEEVSKQRKERTIRFTEKAVEAKAKANEATSNENIASIEEEKKKNQDILDRQRFSISSAEVRATLASHRFPSAFHFISLISDSLKQDGITLSVSDSCEIVAAIFGYDRFESLLNDEGFDNENLSNVKYLYYDNSELAKKLEGIISDGNSNNEDLTSEMLFDHIKLIFDELPYEFSTIDELAQLSLELCENDSYSLLEKDGVSGAMADSDTIFDEVHVEGIVSSNFDEKFTAFINASASGSHRREDDIPGRDMTIEAEIISSVLVGKYALGELKIESVIGVLVDYWQDEDEA